MSDQLFESILTSSTSTTAANMPAYIACIVVALVLGVFLAHVHARGGGSSKGFITTLALLPAVVATVILMVNGSVGTGIAVAGAFSLVRFRSAPGTAREICSIFLGMTCGLVCGMGYLVLAALVCLALGTAMFVFERTGLGIKTGDELRLAITVPENLNFEGEFDDLLRTYTTSYELASVKTTNMGSLYKLIYTVRMPAGQTKALIDELRCRNGNLEISIAKKEATNDL